MRTLVREDSLPVGRDVGVFIVDADLFERALRKEPGCEVVGARADDEDAQLALIEDARGDTREHARQDELRELATTANPRRVVGIDITRQNQTLEIATRAKCTIADSLDLW